MNKIFLSFITLLTISTYSVNPMQSNSLENNDQSALKTALIEKIKSIFIELKQVLATQEKIDIQHTIKKSINKVLEILSNNPTYIAQPEQIVSTECIGFINQINNNTYLFLYLDTNINALPVIIPIKNQLSDFILDEKNLRISSIISRI